ncbi:hypothetical protein GCM10017559_05000 [Streptosporangium longisporum]|uniref:Uncharacterized protein n=1 Tax=Streptosporangium longisporum TaxID=46187 RepID=A0ABN3XQT2_9ACTN
MNDVRVAPATAAVRREWPPYWREEAAADGWQTLRLTGPEAGGEAVEPGPAGELGHGAAEGR